VTRRGSVRVALCSGIVRLCQATLCSTSVDFSKMDFWPPRSAKYCTVRRPDDSVLNAETCCHVTDSVINQYLLCLAEKVLNLCAFSFNNTLL
jgi:hypothetical protein